MRKVVSKTRKMLMPSMPRYIDAEGRHPRHPLDHLHLTVSAVEAVEIFSDQKKATALASNAKENSAGRLAPRKQH